MKTFGVFIAENFEDLQLMSADILGTGHDGNITCLDWKIETRVITRAISLMYQTESLVLNLKDENNEAKVHKSFEPIWKMVFHQIGVWAYG